MKKFMMIVSIVMSCLICLSLICVGCVHNHTYNIKATLPEFLSSEATCTAKAKYYFSCKCGEKGTETFEDGEFLEHIFNNKAATETYLASEATCVAKAKYYFSCECGEKGVETFEHGELISHSFTEYKSDANATYTSNGSKTSVCDYGCGSKDTLMEEFTQKVFDYQDVKIPILSFTGDVSNISKENEVLLSVKYENENGILDCDATLKWQGASSLDYPKKNFTMKLLQKGTNKKLKVEIKEGWGEQNKYCLKANYIDASHARNIVSGRIYSEIVKSRELNDTMETLANGGVVDGFPILIYINSQYQGLYTLNIPKDKWMFGMEDDAPDTEEVTKQALLMADDWTNEVWLRKSIDESLEESGFDLEFCSTEDTIGVDWVKESFNQMIEFINDNDGENFKDGISNYVNIDRTIDSLLFTWLIGGDDNVAKNIIWVTYDGTHWFSSMYDMDSTWGLEWMGEKKLCLDDFWEFNSINLNQLWVKLLENYKDEIENRYLELREDVLSEKNIALYLLDFTSEIPEVLRQCEKEKWKGIPSFNHSSSEYMFGYMKKSLNIIDNYFED